MSRIIPVEDVGSSAMKIRLDLAILIAGGWGTISVRLRRISAVDGVRLALCPLCLSTAPFVPDPSLVMDFQLDLKHFSGFGRMYCQSGMAIKSGEAGFAKRDRQTRAYPGCFEV